MPLTSKQKAFANYYIETGNASEAARRAGYSAKNVNKTAPRMLANVGISAYIAERLRPDEEKRIATADEVVQFYTAVMRGEVKDQFGLDAALTERLKAADALMKRFAATDAAKDIDRVTVVIDV